MANWTVQALALLCLSSAAFADDEPNCKDPQAQVEMTLCAGRDFERADKDLNDAWPGIKADAEESDKNEANGKTDHMDMLLASQRAWLAFRDAECSHQAMAANGGTMQPMLGSICKAKLTRERIKQLQTGVSE